jgi:DNA-binding IclR family transcriptional regulator
VVPGKSYPLHAGGASKLLLAHLPPVEIDRHLHAGLPAITHRTVTDREVLKAELEEIRRRGWAQDRGEYSASVHAIAAPLRDGAGRVVAALSVPFLADADARRRVRLREAVTNTAGRISAALAAAGPVPP